MSKGAEQAACKTEPADSTLRPTLQLVPGLVVRAIKSDGRGRRSIFLVLTVHDRIGVPNRWSTKVNVLDQAGTCTWRWLYELEVVRCP